jgi:hypothetical protein
MGELDDAAARLSRSTSMPIDYAAEQLRNLGNHQTPAWVDETRWKGALSVPETETDPHMFMTQEGITKSDLRDALCEYRALDTWPGSPWADGELGVLSTDFINWYQWERL